MLMSAVMGRPGQLGLNSHSLKAQKKSLLFCHSRLKALHFFSMMYMSLLINSERPATLETG